jgi:hypothetical protein
VGHARDDLIWAPRVASTARTWYRDRHRRSRRGGDPLPPAGRRSYPLPRERQSGSRRRRLSLQLPCSFRDEHDSAMRLTWLVVTVARKTGLDRDSTEYRCDPDASVKRRSRGQCSGRCASVHEARPELQRSRATLAGMAILLLGTANRSPERSRQPFAVSSSPHSLGDPSKSRLFGRTGPCSAPLPP